MQTQRSMDALLVLLDSEALHDQQRFKRANMTAQAAGIAAGFIALIPDRASTVGAALLLLAATVLTFLSDHLKLESKWHAKRDLVEYLHGLKYRYRMRTEPYANEESALNTLQKHFHSVSRPGQLGPNWDVTRSLPLPLRIEWYKDKRVDPQLRFYRLRADRFERRATKVKFLVYLLYGVVIVTAMLQAFGAWQAELVGPIVAVIAGIQTWAAAGRWERTAEIYRQTSQILETASQALEFKGVDEGALASIVCRIEDTLANESQRWLALNNYEISETVSYRAR